MKTINKKLFCAFMAFVVLISCIALPNKVQAGANFGLNAEAKIICTSASNARVKTYNIDAKVSAGWGIDYIEFSLYRTQDKTDKPYKTMKYYANGETYIDLSKGKAREKTTNFFSDNMYGDYNVKICIVDKNGAVGEYNWVKYTVKKDLGSYMSGLYRNFLLRDPDHTGLINNCNAVISGRNSIEDMNRTFYNILKNNEKVNLTNEEFTATLYRGILGRDYDKGGYDNYVRALNNRTLTRDRMVNEFLNSKEFRESVKPAFNL